MRKLIQVFEHQSLRVNANSDFDVSTLAALQRHYGEQGKPYYSLIHNGVRFNQFVGVIQVGKVTIEVLPKVDRTTGHHERDSQSYWQKRLIDILLAVSSVEANHTGTANLSLKANSILETYFALFISEVERLFHKGLIKQYHKQQANLPALKGRLNFSQQLRQNIVHKERFSVEYTVYDHHNIYNQILYKTIKLISQLNSCPQLASRINLLLLNFPEMADIYVDNSTFERMLFNRKNQHYQGVLLIAKLLLLNYHPDITQGRSAVLSLMFDMNQLWEKFVLVSLRRCNKNLQIKIKEQQSKSFWRSDSHKTPVTMKPDIVVHDMENDKRFVLDTKWKCPNYQRPSVEDLRQLYTYHHYYQADKVALIYPTLDKIEPVSGQYEKLANDEQHKVCGLLFIDLPSNHKKITEWQEQIHQQISQWCVLPSP